MSANGFHRMRWRQVAVARIHQTAASQFLGDLVNIQQSMVEEGWKMSANPQTPSDPMEMGCRCKNPSDCRESVRERLSKCTAKYTLLNRKKKTYMKINCLKQPNSNTTTNMKSRIPNIINEHFTGIGPTLANNLLTPKELFTEFLDKSKSPATSFFFCPISPNEVKLEILSMSKNKSWILLLPCQHTLTCKRRLDKNL